MNTVFEWLNGRGGAAAAFPERYAQARRVGAEVHVDLILEIADDATNDWMEREAENGNERKILTPPAAAQPSAASPTPGA